MTLAALLSIAGCGDLVLTPPRDAGSVAPFVATPEFIVDAMLQMADVRRSDVVYDLGSGDGRIVITAAKRYGARGVGFELNADLVRRARESARQAGVEHLVEFRQQDVMTVDMTAATVVTIYLSRDANLRLRPRLQAELRPGARVVSHDFDMGDWPPATMRRITDEWMMPRTLYLWRIDRPARP